MLGDGGWSSARRWGIRLAALGSVLLGARAQAQTAVEVKLHDVAVKVTASTVLPDAKNPGRYGPANLLDQDPNTIWAEGAKSTGAGEWVELSFPPGTPVQAFLVTPGNPKSSSLYLANARPRKAKLELTVGEGGVYAYELEFPKDFPAGGALHVEYIHAAEVKSARLTVSSVWPGSKYKDLCLGTFVPVFRGPEKDTLKTFLGKGPELAPTLSAFLYNPGFVNDLLPPKDSGETAWLRSYAQVPHGGPLPAPEFELDLSTDSLSSWSRYRRGLDRAVAGSFSKSTVFRLLPAAGGKGYVLEPSKPPKTNYRIRWQFIAGQWRVVELLQKFQEDSPDE
jgi:hypothetical protein